MLLFLGFKASGADCWCQHKNMKNNQTNTAAHYDAAGSTVVLESVTWRHTSHLTGD